MAYKDPQEIISRRQRDKNVREMLQHFSLDQHNFNTILLTMVDWIQLQFYSYLDTIIRDPSEKKAMQGRITQAINEIKQVCGATTHSNPEYMVALATVMQEAILHVMQTQMDNGISVSQTIAPKKE